MEGGNRHYDKMKEYGNRAKNHIKNNKKSYLTLVGFIVLLGVIIFCIVYIFSLNSDLTDVTTKNTNFNKQLAAAQKAEYDAEDEVEKIKLEIQTLTDDRDKLKAQLEAKPSTSTTSAATAAATIPMKYNVLTPPATRFTGKSTELVPHTVNCAGGTITNFNLVRPNGSDLQYHYGCSLDNNAVLSFDAPVVKSTTLSDSGNGNVVYFDRHALDCGSKALMQNFKLNQNSDGSQIQFNYNCLPSSKTLSCYDATTDFTDDGNGENIYLDRQNVVCKDGYSLNKFQLNRSSDQKKYQYKYKCCKV